MAELADAPDLGSGGNPRAGSTPVIRISKTELYCRLHEVRFFYIMYGYRCIKPVVSSLYGYIQGGY